MNQILTLQNQRLYSQPKKLTKVTAFEDSIKNVKTPEDKKYYEKQLKNFNKFKSYHDTYVIGKDENGKFIHGYS